MLLSKVIRQVLFGVRLGMSWDSSQEQDQSFKSMVLILLNLKR